MDLAYYREVERLLQRGQFDLVQVEHSWMSWVVPLIRKIAPGLPVVLDLHNIEATLFERWIRYGSDNVGMVVFPVFARPGEGDPFLVTITPEVMIDERGIVIRVDPQQGEGHSFSHSVAC